MKASINDMIIIMVMIFIFAIASIIGALILNAFTEGTTDILTGAESQAALAAGSATLRGMDSLIVFALFALGAGAILMGFMIKVHPAFLIISIFLFVFVIFLASQFANMFMEFASADEMVEAANQFPLSIHLFSNLPLIILLLGAILIIVIYTRMGSTEGGSSYQ